MSIPFFSLTTQWQKIKPSVMPRIEVLLDAQQCIGGSALVDFEKAFAEYTGAQYALSCSSGTSALWLALKALELQQHEIVLTTPFSFIASSSEIYAHGAHPAFIDIDPATMNISPAAMAAWLEENTHIENKRTIHTLTGKPVVGMVVVNIFGQCADYAKLRAIAEQYNLWIVEDAAQSVGAPYGGKNSGALGDIACFSFYPTKNLGAAGDAGMVTTSDEKLAQKVMRLKNHGRLTHYNYEGYGVNARMDALQAVVLDEKLKVLPNLLARRRAIAHRYTAAFKNLPGITPPAEQEPHTFHQYTLLIDAATAGLTRDDLRSALTDHDIGSCIFYPKLLSEISYLQTDRRLYTDCSTARRVCASMLSLPIWPELSDEQVDRIITVVTEIIQKRGLTHDTTSPPRSSHNV
ncbi:MAG: DegT/DnrJ/EryC1/StrS family aminotransferase [Candidatus Dependentiae bacterium]|jgi:dTDP-4-amino-4,6-dideoxygalactose transaminase